jgi:HSP20 family protein
MNNKQNPFDAFNTFAPIFNNLMHEVLNQSTTKTDSTETKETFKVAAANILEVENGYQLQVAFPGFSKEEVVLNIDGDLLKITATKTATEEVPSVKYLKKELDTRNYKRVFNLSNKIDRSKIAAEYKDGVLYITLPKKDDVAFNIEVK